MSRGTKRVALAALGIVAASVALLVMSRRGAAPAASSEREEPASGDEAERLPVAEVAIAPAASPPGSVPAERAPAATSAEPEGPRMAPGAAPWASGLDLPAPPSPLEPPAVDPAHMRYREQAEDVAPADQVAYLEQSVQMIDTSIEILVGDLDAARGTPREASLGMRLARLRQARAERVEELDVMRARAATAPAPPDELEGGAAIRARGAPVPPPSEGI